jgi:hypothetical protein
LEKEDILCHPLTTSLLQLLGTLATDGQARRRMQKVGTVPVLTHLLVVAAAHQRPSEAFVSGAATLHSITVGRTASSGGAVGGKVEAYKAWQRLREVLLGALSNLLTHPESASSSEQQRLFVNAGGLDAAACLLVQQGALQTNNSTMTCSGWAAAACSASVAGARSNDDTSALAVRLRFLLGCLSQRQEWQQPVEDALAAATATAFQRWGYSSGGGAPPSGPEDATAVPRRQVSETGVVAQPVLGSVGMPLSAVLSASVLQYGQSNN